MSTPAAPKNLLLGPFVPLALAAFTIVALFGIRIPVVYLTTWLLGLTWTLVGLATAKRQGYSLVWFVLALAAYAAPAALVFYASLYASH